MTQTKLIKNYSGLRKAIIETLFEGQKELEKLKVSVYWQTGRLIDDYLKDHPEEQGHGQGVVEKLAKDLNMERTLFYRVLLFARQFPNVATWQHLTWSHYRALLSVKDPEQREALTNTADQEKWPARRLNEEIRNHSNKHDESPKGYQLPRLKEPKKGQVGTYKIGWLQPIGEAPRKVIDLGFEIYEEWPFEKNNSDAEKNLFFNYSSEENKWTAQGKGDDLYTYGAHVENVVDGDTLRVQIQLTKQTIKRQYLRLRGINAAPLETAKGKKARDVLARRFRKTPQILFKSRFRDAYGRYVADVWSEDVYINQLLLDKFLAVKVG